MSLAFKDNELSHCWICLWKRMKMLVHWYISLDETSAIAYLQSCFITSHLY